MAARRHVRSVRPRGKNGHVRTPRMSPGGIAILGATALGIGVIFGGAVALSGGSVAKTEAIQATTIPERHLAFAADSVRPSSSLETKVSAGEFTCANPKVTDGDTVRCGGRRVRLAAIDAPELPGHCRTGRRCVAGDPYASSANLSRLIGGHSLTCRQTDIDRYGRTVAYCAAGQHDLSCTQVRQGFAIERYGRLECN